MAKKHDKSKGYIIHLKNHEKFIEWAIHALKTGKKLEWQLELYDGVDGTKENPDDYGVKIFPITKNVRLLSRPRYTRMFSKSIQIME